MASPLLDTHAWIWWIEDDRRLPRRVRATLDQLPRDERPYLSAISLWEVAMLVERGRVVFSVPLSEWLEAAADGCSACDIPPRPCRPAHRRELSRARPPAAHPRRPHPPRAAGDPLARLTTRASREPAVPASRCASTSSASIPRCGSPSGSGFGRSTDRACICSWSGGGRDGAGKRQKGRGRKENGETGRVVVPSCLFPCRRPPSI